MEPKLSFSFQILIFLEVKHFRLEWNSTSVIQDSFIAFQNLMLLISIDVFENTLSMPYSNLTNTYYICSKGRKGGLRKSKNPKLVWQNY